MYFALKIDLLCHHSFCFGMIFLYYVGSEKEKKICETSCPGLKYLSTLALALPCQTYFRLQTCTG